MKKKIQHKKKLYFYFSLVTLSSLVELRSAGFIRFYRFFSNPGIRART